MFSDASNSLAPDRVQVYLHGYRFADGGVGPVPTPAALRDQTVILSDRQPLAFLCLVTGVGGALEVAVVHRLMKYMDFPGEPESGFHDRVLALLGDNMPHQYPTVEVPVTIFHLVGAPVRVPTTAAMQTLLPTTWADPATRLSPSYTDADLETEVVRPRHVQLLPCRYAAILVHRPGVTPKVAYQELVGAMKAQGKVEACHDVIVWLKAACTQRGGQGPQSGVPIVYHALTPVHVPPAVDRLGKVQADLSALTTPDALTSEVTGTLAGALRALTRADGAGDRTVAQEVKTVAEVYRETYRTILRFGNVAQVEQLAPVWQRLANSQKASTTLYSAYKSSNACVWRGVCLQSSCPDHHGDLKTDGGWIPVCGPRRGQLESGSQPFVVSFAGSSNHMQALEAVSIGIQIAQGKQSASLADYRTLREKEKIRFPHDIMEVCITLGRYAVLCQALFQGTGEDNPLVSTGCMATVHSAQVNCSQVYSSST